jgi:hypothetical protein
MVLPQLLQAETNEEWDYQNILDQLERVYDNPTKRDTAASRLQGLRQGNDALPVFLAKFERLLHEANANSWPDDSKIAILRNGVNDKLKAKLDVQLELPGKYDKFVRSLHKLGGHGGSGQGNSPGTFGKLLTPRTDEPMDLSMMDARDNEILRASTIRIGRSVRFAPSTTPAQRQARREAGVCVRCGDPDHWAQDCSYAPASHAPFSDSVSELSGSSSGYDD